MMNKYKLKQNLRCPETGADVGVLQIALKGESEDEVYYFCRTTDGDEGWFHEDSLIEAES